MRHEYDRTSRNVILKRFDQLTVKVMKMVLRRLKEFLCMRLHVRRLQMKLGKLKCQALERCAYGLESRQIPYYMKGLMAYDESLEAVSDRVILHQNFIGLKHVVDFFHRRNLHVLESCPPRLLRTDFPQQFHELLLTPGNLFFRNRIRSSGPSCGAKLVEPAIKDVQLLADFENTLQAWGVVHSCIPDRLEVFFKKVDQRPGL